MTNAPSCSSAVTVKYDSVIHMDNRARSRPVDGVLVQALRSPRNDSAPSDPSGSLVFPGLRTAARSAQQAQGVVAVESDPAVFAAVRLVVTKSA